MTNTTKNIMKLLYIKSMIVILGFILWILSLENPLSSIAIAVYSDWRIKRIIIVVKAFKYTAPPEIPLILKANFDCSYSVWMSVKKLIATKILNAISTGTFNCFMRLAINSFLSMDVVRQIPTKPRAKNRLLSSKYVKNYPICIFIWM